MSKNIYFLALDISSDYLDGTTEDNPIIGRGSGDSLSGRTLIPASNFSAAHHELGHTFGLAHDSNLGGNRIFTLSGYNDWMTNSFCAAEWLDVNRYFNPTQEAFNTDTKVQMLTPSLAAPPADILLKFEATDPDGLHQVQLYKTYGSYPSVIDYQSLNGTRATVEFVKNELIDGHNIILRVIDKHGNFIEYSYPLEITDLLPPTEVIPPIPDANLEAHIRKTLELAPDHTITQLDMLRLTDLSYLSNSDNPVIRDFTGLEYAKNLKSLYLEHNPIGDFSPLEELTNLEELTVKSVVGRGYQTSDFSPLEKLTNLRVLGLEGGVISDNNALKTLGKLTNLERLSLKGNRFGDIGLSDISPLENLTKLKDLTIVDNQISDITPLAGLANLRYLNIYENKISDPSPIVGLTNLRRISLAKNQISDVSSLENLKITEVL